MSALDRTQKVPEEILLKQVELASRCWRREVSLAENPLGKSWFGRGEQKKDEVKVEVTFWESATWQPVLPYRLAEALLLPFSQEPPPQKELQPLDRRPPWVWQGSAAHGHDQTVNDLIPIWRCSQSW
jgi:hypothetical protein